MQAERDKDLEGQISQWRDYMRRRSGVHEADAEELEDHLRSTIAELTAAGLRPDEAFLVAVKRMGSLDDLSREFAREHSDRLWKQLVLPAGPEPTGLTGSRKALVAMLVCAAVAAILIKLPAAFGIDFDDDTGFYQANFGLLVLAPLAAYFVWRRRVRPAVAGVLAGLFAVGALAANAYPLAGDSQSLVLTAIHLTLALWLVVGVAYAGGEWRSESKRMDFIRFTGEWFIYFVLIALGGGVLIAFTVGTFQAIGVDVGEFVGNWLVPSGFAAAVVVAAWLVEAKQNVVENMAPVLTRVFTPLFALALGAFLVAFFWTRSGFDVERDLLILFDLLLVVVLGLLLYSISARDRLAPPGLFDRLQLWLVLSALFVDALVLVAITSRITEFGFTPNKTAALGENLILLANLAWSAWLYYGFLRKARPFAALERWQTSYVTVYALWAWMVVLVFPPIFNFA